MKLSIVIPTHNRADQLKTLLNSLSSLKDEVDYDIIVVDNNSSDHTKEVALSFSDKVKYVFEERTSFTRARSTGEKNATGDVLLYIDDDVVVDTGSLERIMEIFSNNPECGVIAGRIMPQFSSEPPDWCLACQRVFNGWSLYNAEQYPHLGAGKQEVEWAAGPMMAIRREAYLKVGGFPPDTIGVETNTGENSFRKLFIGPGDYGICYYIRNAGYYVLYAPEVSCKHVIPPARFGITFWRARMICEGQQTAITQRGLYKLSWFQEKKKYMLFRLKQAIANRKYVKRVLNSEASRVKLSFDGIFSEELWVDFYDAYFKMNKVLKKYPDLYKNLWELGLNGVDKTDYEQVLKTLPREYLELVDPKVVYFEGKLDINSIKKL